MSHTLPGNDFLTDARRRWRLANEAETENRKEGLEDLNFLDLKQWPTNVEAIRNETGRERPCLTIDQIGQPYRQLVSQQQQSDAAIRIVPERGGANIASAELIQGLIRSIEYQSEAQTGYGMAFAQAAGPGWGYIRIRSDYESADSFDQKIIIEGIENAFAVYIDPAARQPDRSDMGFAFITQRIPWEDYKRDYPDSSLAKQKELPSPKGGVVSFDGLGDADEAWFLGGEVMIAEYFYIDYTRETRYEGSDGKAYVQGTEPEGVTLSDRARTVRKPSVCWCKINGLEIIEGARDEKKNASIDQTKGRVIPGTSIPIRPCYGEVLNVNGRRVYRGIVRPARDPQRMYNYQNSSLVEDLALAPKPPIMGMEGQFEGHEDKWEQANVRAFPYLEYRNVNLNGSPAPPPGRPAGPDAGKIQATVMAIAQAKSDLRSTTGWYDATDPNRRNADQSGKAIQARKASQNENGVTYFENLRKMLVSTGKLLLEWIPAIYDRPGRVVQVLGMEDKPEWAMVGVPFTRGKDGMPVAVNEGQTATGEILRLDPSSGIYGVRVTIGAGHTTRREEAAETIGGLMANIPSLMGVIGDKYVENLDIPDAPEMAARIKRTIPPQILGEEGMEDVPPQVQAQMAQMKQAIDQLQAELAEKTRELETRQIDNQTKLQIADRKLQGDMAMEQLREENKRSIAELQNETKVLAEQVKLLIAQQQIQSSEAQAKFGAQATALQQMGDMASKAARSVSPGSPT